jgi:putative ABC transport system permease protein
MWRSFYKTTFRNLVKFRSFTFVNILGLSFGLAIFIAIALYIQFEFSFDKFHVNAENIYRVEQIMNEGGRVERMTGTPEPLWQVMDEFPEVETAIRFVPFQRQTTDRDGNAFNLNLAYVEDNFLEYFSFPLLKGNPEDVLQEPVTIVLTESTAGRLFGKEDPVGSTYKINDVEYRVTGVVKDPPDNSHMQFDALIPANTLKRLFGDDTFTHWGNNWVRLFVVMKEGHDIEAFKSQIQYILKKHFHEETLNELTCRNILSIHLHSDLIDDYTVRGDIRNIYILIAIAIFILVMAGVNFTNLSVAYSSLRIREVGIRKINGGTRSILLTQFMGEYIVMTAIAILVGFVLFETLLPVFNQLVSRNLEFQYLQNVPLFLFILVVGISLGLFSGLYPATLLSGYQPVQILRIRISKGARGIGLREILIGIQFVISAALIIGTMGVLRQANYMKNKDLGFNPRSVIRILFRDSSMVRIYTFRDLILQNPGIINASVHDYPVCQSENWTRISWEGAGEDEWIRINVNYADHHYLETYEMRLKEGTGFTRDRFGSEEAGREVILNRAAIQRIGFEDPIGRYIEYWGDYKIGELGPVKIAGVVDDFHFLSVHNQITPMMIRLYDEGQVGWSIAVRMDGINLPGTMEFIENRFDEIFPELPFDYEFVYDFHAQMYGEEEKMAGVVLALAIIAIVIACLGIYGLVAFTTSRRKNEVGIRKAMGADFSKISFLFLKELMVLIIIANLIAWPAGYFIVRNWLQSFPYQVGFSIGPYVVVLLLTILFTFISMMYHTYKSARLQPAESLRYE